MERTGHPDDQVLAAFSLGEIEGDRWEEVRRHVAECDTCCDRLDSVADDPFVRHARAAAKSHAADFVADGADWQAIPTQLASHPRYEVIRRIGEGGMGVVYAANHRLMDRPVALKVLRPQYVTNQQTVDRFRQEVRSAAKLSHPNIVTAYDADHADGLHFLVMEYVEGQSLDRLVDRRGPLKISQACQYVSQVASALQHAHEHGMVHRDIKPHNLMLTEDGDVNVLDFGLARFVQHEAVEHEAAVSSTSPGTDSALTSASTLLGTPDYMAPEQATDSREVDIRADIYSLGCTLYFLLTGQPPFKHASDIEKVMAKAALTPQPLRSLRGEVPAELEGLVQRMMAVDPAERFQTPADAAKALQRFATPRESRSRTRVMAKTLATLGGVLTAVIAVLIYFNTGHGQLVIDVKQPGVNVTLDGRRLELRSGNDVVSVEVGEHELVATKDGFQSHTRQFRLFRGQKELVTVRLEPNSVANRDAVAEVAQPASDEETASDGESKPVLPAVTNTADVTLLRADVDAQSVLFMGDGRLMTCGWNATIWDVQHAQKTAEFSVLKPVRGAGMSAVDLSPDDTRLAVATWHTGDPPEFPISVFDIRTGQRLRRFSVGGEHSHTDVITDLAYSPDGLRIASCGRDGWVRVWNAVSGEHIENLRDLSRPDTMPFETVSFVADGRIAAAGAGGGRDVVIWRVETGKRQIVNVPHDVHYQLRFSADGRRALVGGVRSGTPIGTNRGKLTFIDLENHRVLPLDSQFSGVNSVALSPDGRTGISGHFDGTVRYWDLDHCRLLHEFKGHASSGRAAALSADGKIAAHLADDCVFVFPLSMQDEAVNAR